KAFLDGRFSVQVTMPFASTGSEMTTDGIIRGGTTEAGNLFLTLKALLMSCQELTVSGGIGFSLPTANDTRLNIGGSEMVRIYNDATLLVPFVAMLWTPSDRTFLQAWVQGSVDPQGNAVRVMSPTTGLRTEIGKIYDPSVVSVDVQAGYWVIHPASRDCGFF